MGLKLNLSNKLRLYPLALLLFLIEGSALELPKQFESENAAVILGLDSKTQISDKDVDLAARRLTLKYHPDRYQNPEQYTDEDRKQANEVTAKIQSARRALIKYLETNPDYNPSTSPSGQGSHAGFTSGQQRSSYSWEEFLRSRTAPPSGSSSRDLVSGDHYGASLRGTLFEFLYRFPDFKSAVIPFEIRSPDLGDENLEALMILTPEHFPFIEFRYISKKQEGKVVQIVRSTWAQYVRGHHQGNSGRALSDGILFENGNYLFNALPGSRPEIPYVVTPIDEAGQHLYIQSSMLMFLTEMNPRGFSVGTSYVMLKKEAQDLLPNKKHNPALDWKNIAIEKSNQPIALGYKGGLCDDSLK